MEFGQRDGKMYYKIQKHISNKYSGTIPRVIVTLGPTPYSKGPVPCSEDQAWGVCFICINDNLQTKVAVWPTGYWSFSHWLGEFN